MKNHHEEKGKSGKRRKCDSAQSGILTPVGNIFPDEVIFEQTLEERRDSPCGLLKGTCFRWR